VYEYSARIGDDYVKDLWRKTTPLGRSWQFVHDTYGNLLTVTDPKGTSTATQGDFETTYTYDAHGRLTETRDANDNPPTVNSEFDPNGYPRLITDPKGNGTEFIYDERGQVTKVTDTLGGTLEQTYDTFGRPGENKVSKDRTAGSYITTRAPLYDANDNVEQAFTATGAVSSATYNQMDQTSSSTALANNQAADRVTSYAYDGVGNLKTVTEPKGSATTGDNTDFTTAYAYDAIYQLTDVVNADGDKISYRYDDVGNQTVVIDPVKNNTPDTTDYTSKTIFDLNHRPKTVTDAAGESASTEYDLDSRPVVTVDKAGERTEVDYDERSLPVEQRVPYNDTRTDTTRFRYDQVGNRTAVITPRGVASGREDAFTAVTTYDELNRLLVRHSHTRLRTARLIRRDAPAAGRPLRSNQASR